MKIDYNNLTVLEGLGVNYTDFWTPSVQGIFDVPEKCYTYQPKWLIYIGFGAKVRLRMKVPEKPSVMLLLHNNGALVPSIARIFGSDFSMVFINPNETIKTYNYIHKLLTSYQAFQKRYAYTLHAKFCSLNNYLIF